VKQRALKEAARRYGLKSLVETGTFLGDMLAAMREDFDSLTSIELSEELFRRAQVRFAGDPKITLLNGDSKDVLEGLVPSIDQPTLFWLDAHYSGAWHEDFEETAGGDRPLPIYEELEAVFASDYQHVVFIDDARLFTPAHENWPSVEDIRSFVKEHQPDRTVLVSEDIIRVLP